jgi:hypothetical protein
MRPKNTSRSEARRRHREEQRDAEAAIEPNTLSDQVEAEAEQPPRRSLFAMPDIAGDIRALPQIFRKPLVWLPFGMLLLSAAIVLAWDAAAMPEGQVTDLGFLYVQLTLPPTSLFVFFIGGFVAPRGSYLVGAILGAFDALLITLLASAAPDALAEVLTGSAGVVEDGGTGLGDVASVWGIAIPVGILAAGFAAWYRRFLRSSQERAAANRAAREREQAQKAKEQAREDKARLRAQKQEDREARRKTSK